MSRDTPVPKIITFYSYEGGTGRSMALANVTWILAGNGKRVLAVDWDLEAPGLYRYFYPFLVDRELTASDGVIDFVIQFATAAATPDAIESEPETTKHQVSRTSPQEAASATTKTGNGQWYRPYSNILRYAFSLDWSFGDTGTLDYLPAGRQGPSYSTRVNSFNWRHFYDRLGGGTLLEMAKERMRGECDYILIDSRTGVSDTSGICTVQMPDILAVCFPLNNQSIAGARAVAQSVDAQRRDPTGQPTVRIFPIPTRVERAEKDKLEAARELAQQTFEPFL